MGCFSYICLECNEPITSNILASRAEPFIGEDVKLFYLEDCKVVESMQGQYNSYGQVLKEGSTDIRNDSVEWTMDWSEAVEKHYNNHAGDGFAAVHTKCLKEGFEPSHRSKDDHFQGWGEDHPFHPKEDK